MGWSGLGSKGNLSHYDGCSSECVDEPLCGAIEADNAECPTGDTSFCVQDDDAYLCPVPVPVFSCSLDG